MFKRYYSNKIQSENGQGLVEYALILVLVSMVVIFVLTETGLTVSNVYCAITNALGGACDSGFAGGDDELEEDDVIAITNISYNSLTHELHLDAISNGGWDPGVTLVASPGGIMVRKTEHYHALFILTGCPCTVTITSSGGGSSSTTVGP
jgi:pilus assembly protein Flp/PilA